MVVYAIWQKKNVFFSDVVCSGRNSEFKNRRLTNCFRMRLIRLLSVHLLRSVRFGATITNAGWHFRWKHSHPQSEDLQYSYCCFYPNSNILFQKWIPFSRWVAAALFFQPTLFMRTFILRCFVFLFLWWTHVRKSLVGLRSSDVNFIFQAQTIRMDWWH